MEAGDQFDVHQERAAGVSTNDLCELVASRSWVSQDEAVKEGGHSLRDFPGTGVSPCGDFSPWGPLPCGSTSHHPDYFPKRITW